jgi:hypothetical protein
MADRPNDDRAASATGLSADQQQQHLAELQRRFAAHIRDPGSTPAPAGIEDRRMGIYRELFFNNLAGLLAGNFPVLNRILGPDRWQGLVRDFYRDHRCRTPLFHEIAQEFLGYLGEERGERPEDPRFIYELAHYEWVELALSLQDTAPDAQAADPQGDLLAGIPVLSPLAWPLAYRFPVHRLSPQFQPTEPPAEPSFYVVYRDRSDRVGFINVNAVTLRLVERLQQEPDLTGSQQLEAMARELPQLDAGTLRAGGAQALAPLRAQQVILGTRSARTNQLQ